MKDYYRRNLPHYQPEEGEYFVTFRLANSLPQKVIQSLKREFKKSLEAEETENRTRLNKRYFRKFDNILDNYQSDNNWLENHEIAKIVADKLHEFHDEKYFLICYCIMPNHVHLLFRLPERDESRSTKQQFPVTDILRLIKGATAREANVILGRTGTFWQHESYDHLVRNNEERERTIRYILKNPVKAGLINSCKGWKWTYCADGYLPIR